MAVLEKRKPNFYIRENHATAQPQPRYGDGEGLGVVLFATASLVIFAFALWLMLAKPFAETGGPTDTDTGVSTIGSYAPVEHLPATGTMPLLDDSYRRTVR